MKNSTFILIRELIDDYGCPFTQSEVHGFFTGLVLLKISDKDLDKKILAFMDIDESSLPKTHQLIESIRKALKANNLNLSREEKNDYYSLSSSLSEWAYYFLIAFQTQDSSNIDDHRIIDILDVFDEISQLNQKYKIDDDNDVNEKSLDDINDFIEKSVQYIFNKK
tara:strand:- start:261 stop:758 length:498 start_codon:yes stop_codon:yes gene_type:complete